MIIFIIGNLFDQIPLFKDWGFDQFKMSFIYPKTLQSIQECIVSCENCAVKSADEKIMDSHSLCHSSVPLLHAMLHWIISGNKNLEFQDLGRLIEKTCNSCSQTCKKHSEDYCQNCSKNCENLIKALREEIIH